MGRPSAIFQWSRSSRPSLLRSRPLGRLGQAFQGFGLSVVSAKPSKVSASRSSLPRSRPLGQAFQGLGLSAKSSMVSVVSAKSSKVSVSRPSLLWSRPLGQVFYGLGLSVVSAKPSKVSVSRPYRYTTQCHCRKLRINVLIPPIHFSFKRILH